MDFLPLIYPLIKVDIQRFNRFAAINDEFSSAIKKKMMNCKEANEKSIIDYLNNLGITPTRGRGKNVMFKSPLRADSDPSFRVNPIKNTWVDYGTGEGGSLIDLICILHSVDVSGAIEIISGEKSIRHSSFFKEQYNSCSTEPGIKINHIQKLQNRALIQYLESRKISINRIINNPKLFEAYFTLTASKKKQFALAFINDIGGYELRSAYFKGCNSKSITTVQGNKSALNIFEGWIDYISALTYFKISKPNFETIILNSTSLLKNILPGLKKYGAIYAYLDNDETGYKAFATIQDQHQEVINRSEILYPQYSDFNDYICREKI